MTAQSERLAVRTEARRVTARISVVICTFNRCATLEETLQSLVEMNVPDDIDWDVLVVDNNSTDQTRNVVGRVSTRSAVEIRYLFEPTQGLSHARNLGITSSDKDYIAFTDDDVVVDSNWLTEIVRVFQETRADCVGGKVIAKWLQQQRPQWLSDDLLNVLSMLDHGDLGFEFDPGDVRLLYGANMAFRRDTLIALGLFDVNLGRIGNLGVGEDKEMLERLVRRGGRAVYSPSIVVFHKIYPERLCKRYFREWHYAAGRDRAKIRKPSRFTILGVEVDLFVMFARSLTSLIASALPGHSDRRFSAELKLILYFSVLKHKLRGGARPGALNTPAVAAEGDYKG